MEKLEIIESSEAMYDVIVLGAGIVGSSAAYQAQRAGNKTLLIEQVGI